MSEALRVAVIGVGHLGKHHARILAAMPGVTLVGVADPDAANVVVVGRRVSPEEGPVVKKVPS